MIKTCPFGYSNAVVHCDDKCVMYEEGCLLKKAVKTYIDEHSLLKMPQPTDQELQNLINIANKYIHGFESSHNDMPF